MIERRAQDPVLLRRLLTLARDFLQARDMGTVLELAGKAIPKVLRSDGSLLLVVSGDREWVTAFDQQGIVPRAPRESGLLPYARRAMTDGTPILLPEIAADAARVESNLPTLGAASLLAYPFPPVAPVGALVSVWHRKGHRKDLARLIPVMRHLGQLTGAALGSVSLRHGLEEQLVAQSNELAEAVRAHAVELSRRDSVEEELNRIALTDVLTGLLNRRGFFLHAERCLKIARRERLPGALIFLDVDGLKAVNDRYGHDAGDDLLEDMARLLEHSFRDADVVARIGGDEFAAFTIDAEQPDVLLARLRDSLASFGGRPDAPYRISFSTGIVQCDAMSGLTLSDYLLRADSLMYEQKRDHPSGR